MTVMPRALARALALTRLTRSVDRCLEQAAQDRRGQRRPVELGELAGDLEGQGAHAAARELGEEASEDLGERQVRGDRPRRLRGEQRRVDGVPCAPAVEDVEDLRRDLLRDEDLRLRGRGAEVRRQQRVRRVEERRAGRRLLLEDVDPGAAEMAGPQRLGDRRLVDHAAARDVEDDRAGSAAWRSPRAR